MKAADEVGVEGVPASAVFLRRGRGVGANGARSPMSRGLFIGGRTDLSGGD